MFLSHRRLDNILAILILKAAALKSKVVVPTTAEPEQDTSKLNFVLPTI